MTDQLRALLATCRCGAAHDEATIHAALRAYNRAWEDLRATFGVAVATQRAFDAMGGQMLCAECRRRNA